MQINWLFCVSSVLETHEFYWPFVISFKLNDVRGKKPFTVNARTVAAFWEIGQGYEDLDKYGTPMKMLGLLLKSSYNDINKKLNTAYAESAIESMQNSV